MNEQRLKAIKKYVADIERQHSLLVYTELSKQVRELINEVSRLWAAIEEHHGAIIWGDMLGCDAEKIKVHNRNDLKLWAVLDAKELCPKT